MVVQDNGCTGNAVQEMLYIKCSTENIVQGNVVLKILYWKRLYMKCCTETVVKGNVGQEFLYRKLLYRKYVQKMLY